jgi:ketosteroid isomerase-like protein
MSLTNEQKIDEQQIQALYHAGDAALMRADVVALSEILADDYIQYNDAGQPFTRSQILANFRSGAIRYPTIVSTGRVIRLFGDTAVVHGSEEDEVETQGTRYRVRYLYLDVLLKREGKWKLVASQLARPAA